MDYNINMPVKVIEKKLNTLSRELAMLRSMLMAMVAEKDPEGEYRPEFVARMLSLAGTKRKSIAFKGSGDFLKKIS